MTSVSELEPLVQSGAPLSRPQAEAMLSTADLIGVGLLGEMARHASTGDRVTYGRVCVITPKTGTRDIGAAGELRLVGRPASVDEATAWLKEALPLAAGRSFSAFSLADLASLVGFDAAKLTETCRALRGAGLEALAEAPIDLLGDTDRAISLVQAAIAGGVAVRRATISSAPIDARLGLIEATAAIQAATGAFKAFAPLPANDPADSPATGYDDVRTVAAARLMCRSIPFIQVDWSTYGPKLAQVAIAYGANDLDGIAPVDRPELGSRRSAREEIERQIRAAFATPVERDGRYEARV